MNITKLNKPIKVMNIIAVIMIMINLVLVFFWVPTERTMGAVQRIFYFHVGANWASVVAFAMALLGGGLYLWRRNFNWDIFSEASVEIGLLFASIGILSGSIWGRPAWNTWWIWSPRLTSVTVMWLVYAAYFMLRGAIENKEQRARFAAIYVILGFVTVIVTFFSARLLRDIHPIVIGQDGGGSQGEQSLTPKMVFTMLYSFVTFTVLYATWLLNRMRLLLLSEEVSKLKMQVMARLRT